MIDAGTVRFCDPAQEGDDAGTVRFCDPAQEGDDVGRVVFCNGEEQWEGITPGDPCYGIVALAISGPTNPEIGSQYAASGGKPPYTWSISAGAIGSGGAITSLAGACGTGTVTVHDACGNSAQQTVLFPSGQWVLDGWVPAECGKTESAMALFCIGTYNTCVACEEIRGSAKRLKVYGLVSKSSPYNCSSNDCLVCSYCSPSGAGILCESDNQTQYKCILYFGYHAYTWECP
jgi:hypothetical protein